jgi:aspartyl-tRNA synthetase
MAGEIRVAGWVSEVRDLGKLRFIVLRGERKVQITMKRGEVSDDLFSATEDLPQESVIEVIGFETDRKIARSADLEVIPKEIRVISRAEKKLPLDPNWKVQALFPTRMKYRPLDLRRPEVQAVFKIEASFIKGAMDWLDENGFLMVFTPSIIGAASESGAEVFEVKYFDKKAYLRQDPQLHRQLTILGGFTKIYDIGPNWRADPSHTTRHMSEFRSIAVEMAFISDEEDTMRVEEQVIVAGMRRVQEERQKELELLGVQLEIPKTPFPEIRFPQVYEVLEDMGKRIEYGGDYDTESEELLWRYAKEKYNSDFIFVNRFPFAVKPFYVMKADDTWARSVDLIYKGEEVSSGGQREHRYDVLMRQIEEKKLDKQSLEWFTSFFRYGAPPHGGFALGLERFIYKMLSLQNIREAALFPRDIERVLP